MLNITWVTIKLLISETLSILVYSQIFTKKSKDSFFLALDNKEQYALSYGFVKFSNSIPVHQIPRNDNGSVEESDNEQREQLTKFHESENFERNYLLILETLAFKLYGSQELDKNTDEVISAFLCWRSLQSF